MMNFCILILSLTITTVISTRGYHDKILLQPMTTTSKIFRGNRKPVFQFKQAAVRRDLPKIIFLKHLLELNCMKEIYNQNRNKNPSGRLKGRPQQMPAFRNDGSHNKKLYNFHRQRPNLTSIESSYKINNIGKAQIQIPPSLEKERDTVRSSNILYNTEDSKNKKIYNLEEDQKLNLKLEMTKPWTNISKNNSEEDNKKYVNQDAESLMETEVFLKVEETHENKDDLSQFEIENSGVETENYNIPVMLTLNHDDKKISQQPSKASFPERTSSYNFWHLTRPHQNQPYEVEEIIEENVRVDLGNGKEENLGFSVNQDNIPKQELVNIKGDRKEPQNLSRVMDKSIGTILRELMGPMLGVNPSSVGAKESFSKTSEKKDPENIQNPQNGGIREFMAKKDKAPFISSNSRDFSNQYFLGGKVKQSDRHENLRSFNPKPKHFKEMFHNRKQLAAEMTVEYENPNHYYLLKSPTKGVTESQEKYEKSLFTPSDFLRSDFFSKPTSKDPASNFHLSIQNQKQKTVEPKKVSFTLVDPTQRHQNLNFSNFIKYSKKLAEGKEFQGLFISSTPVTTQKVLNTTEHNTTQSRIMIIDNEISSTPFSPLRTISNSSVSETKDKIVSTFRGISDKNVSIIESTTIKFSEHLTDIPKVELPKTAQNFNSSTKYFSEKKAQNSEITTQYFKEFNDSPVKIDLLEANQSNLNNDTSQEADWRNNRKMHFGQDIPKTTIPKNVPETEQRRSDILISENLEDYTDNQNQLTALTYLEKLKQSLSSDSLTNTTYESIIPLIPTIINDLREGRISSNDTVFLSKVLHKYWPYIIDLSNKTHLDLLPLLKMKNEKDLKDIMQSFVLVEAVVTTATTTTTTTTTEEPEKYLDNIRDYNQNYYYLEDYKDLYEDIFGQELKEKRKKLRPKRNEKDDVKRVEATREYFESLYEEQNDGGTDYNYEDDMYGEFLKNDDSSVFELMEVANMYFNTKNETWQGRQK